MIRLPWKNIITEASVLLGRQWRTRDGLGMRQFWSGPMESEIPDWQEVRTAIEFPRVNFSKCWF
jgi:hypothetical protein